MSNPFQPAIDQIQEQVKSWENEILPITTKIRDAQVTINGLCKLAGEPLLYPEVAGLGAAAGALTGSVKAPETLAIKNDLFVGKPLATAAKTVLEMRYNRAGTTSPASVDEIHAGLTAGGFEFSTRDPDTQKRGLAVSLAKNSYTFRRLNGGLFGLVEWYPTWTKKTAKPRANMDTVAAISATVGLSGAAAAEMLKGEEEQE